MCFGSNEAFRKKVIEVSEMLKADVASRGDLIVYFDAQAQKNVLLNITEPSNAIIKLERSDVFLVERVAYYHQDSNGLLQSADDTDPNTTYFYQGKLSYTQMKTKVASNLYLRNFVHRNITSGTDRLFELSKVSYEVSPYWLLSGERDNEVQIEFFNVPNPIPNFRFFVHLQGVLFPNTYKNLS